VLLWFVWQRARKECENIPPNKLQQFKEGIDEMKRINNLYK
jgi:hypothetical protein